MRDLNACKIGTVKYIYIIVNNIESRQASLIGKIIKQGSTCEGVRVPGGHL